MPSLGIQRDIVGSGWRSLGGTSSVFCYQSMAVYESLALSKPIAIEFWLPGELAGQAAAGLCSELACRAASAVGVLYGTVLQWVSKWCCGVGHAQCSCKKRMEGVAYTRSPAKY